MVSKKDRALATGIFNSGTNVAAIIGPPLIAWIFSSYGWQGSFYLDRFLWIYLVDFLVVVVRSSFQAKKDYEGRI
ncbi:MAG: MFS transporter [Puia sp.]